MAENKDKVASRGQRRKEAAKFNEKIRADDAKKKTKENAGKQKVAPSSKGAPTEKAIEKDRELNRKVTEALDKQFCALELELRKTSGTLKMPRALVLAIEALRDAKELALRHVKHNV